jgi:hypothetical protein
MSKGVFLGGQVFEAWTQVALGMEVELRVVFPGRGDAGWGLI